MPKINQEEYEVLKGLDDKWKWIARDKDNTLVMGAGKNERYLDGWFPPVNIGDSLVADEINAVKVISEWENLFQFIQWEDEEPYEIAELIEEYETPKSKNGGILIRDFLDMDNLDFTEEIKELNKMYKEREEAEVKTLESIREEIWEEMLRLENKRKDQWADIKYQTLREVLQKLGHLDEPEVLSQEFIDKYKVDYDNWMPAVPIVHLQNLLVPKQEEITEEQEEERPETVARVIYEYMKATQRFKEVLGMEVEELED